MTSTGKNVYLICIADTNHRNQQYTIVASTLTAAITQAQTAAGYTSGAPDPQTTQQIAGPIQYEV